MRFALLLLVQAVQFLQVPVSQKGAGLGNWVAERQAILLAARWQMGDMHGSLLMLSVLAIGALC
jgi:hypothetical protein